MSRGKDYLGHSLSGYLEENTKITDTCSMKISKGFFAEDTLFYAWDAVDFCSGTNCIATEVCPYTQSGINKATGKFEQRKCAVQKNFLRSLSVILYRNYYEIISESQLYRIGMHLMPLYKMLSKLYIVELGVERVAYSDAKGMVRVHPVYKEIRETVKSISQEWHNLGLSNSPIIPSLDEATSESTYYENLERSSGLETEATTSRLVRRRA